MRMIWIRQLLRALPLAGLLSAPESPASDSSWLATGASAEQTALMDARAKHADMAHDPSIQLDVNQLDRITRADAYVATEQASVDSDPLKPMFHIMAAAGSTGDPNGLIYAKGKYHVFFQHSPYMVWGKPVAEWPEGKVGPQVSWGHVSSVDGVYWQHEPIAIMPQPGSYDPGLCASGSAVMADDGTPTIFYTAAEPQTQCIARSQDPNLRYWRKDPNNPILYEPKINNFRKGGFRDPFLWREGKTWNLITCGATTDQGGMAVHFQSENLTNWTHVGALAEGMGPHCVAWECPTFMRFGDQSVLVVSPLFDNLQDTDHAPRGSVSYTIGPYKNGSTFTPGEWKPLDIGSPNDFYATQCLKTPDGRYLLWSMIIGGGSPGHNWSGKLSLPRVITVRPDGLLSQAPAPELKQLRRAHWGKTNLDLAGEHTLAIKSATCEIIAEIEIGTAKVVGLDVRASDDFSTKTRISYDASRSILDISGHKAGFKLLAGEHVLRLQVFVDRSVMEAFVNGRLCGTVQPFQDINDKAIRLFSEGGTARIRSVGIWEMGSVWARPAQ